MHQTGLARDLVTAADGTTTVVATAEMHVVTDYTQGMLVRELTMTPAVDGLDALVGARAGGGFRKVLDLDTGAERGSLPYLLLDDVPGATLVSGIAMTIAADRGDAELEEFRTRMQDRAAPADRRSLRRLADRWHAARQPGRRPSAGAARTGRAAASSTTTTPTPGTRSSRCPNDVDPTHPSDRRVARRRSCTSTCSSATA